MVTALNTTSEPICETCVRTARLLEMIEDDAVLLSKNDGGLLEYHLGMPDTFHYACADSEPFSWDDIDHLYLRWNPSGKSYGLIFWVAERRGYKPVIEIVEEMEKEGYVFDGLKDNPENANGRRW